MLRTKLTKPLCYRYSMRTYESLLNLVPMLLTKLTKPLCYRYSMRTYESLARVGEEDGKDKFLINYELIAHLLGTPKKKNHKP